MKQWTIRMPEELFEWLRDKAAMETIAQKTRVSMNALVVQILSDARERNETQQNSAQ